MKDETLYAKEGKPLSRFVKIFRRNEGINYDLLFYEQYQSLQVIYLQYVEEQDMDIKRALLHVIIEKYKELLSFIEEGAAHDPQEIKLLLKHAKQELKELENR